MMYLDRVPVKGSSVRRLSRSETQAATRERLLDAAEGAFADEGFAGASLDRIAAAAGFTRGAVYSNFADKTDLFVAVLDRRLERRSKEISAIMREAHDPADFLATLGSDEQLGSRRTPALRRWMLLHDEFRLFALRNPSAAKRLAAHERRERDYYAAATEELLGQLGVPVPGDVRLVAAVIFALDESLPRQRCIDPGDIADSAFYDAVRLLIDAAVALSARS